MHLLKNSDLSLKLFPLFIKLIIYSYSVKHNLLKSGLGLQYTFVIIVHITEKLILSRFSCQMCFANSVLFPYFSCLKSYVISVPFFKSGVSWSEIKFFFIIGVDIHVCSIYNWWSMALTIKWAFILYPTIDSKWLLL